MTDEVVIVVPEMVDLRYNAGVRTCVQHASHPLTSRLREQEKAVSKSISNTLSSKDADRFHASVDRSSGPDSCWPFTGIITAKGYGRFKVRGQGFQAHRVAFVLATGQEIPDDLLVCHHCDNRPCCNPACLFLGTNEENMADMKAKGRAVALSGEWHWSRQKPERLARGDRHVSRTRPECVPRGEGHGRATITTSLVLQMVELSTSHTHKQIAETLGASIYVVHQVLQGRTWCHVTGIKRWIK